MAGVVAIGFDQGSWRILVRNLVVNISLVVAGQVALHEIFRTDQRVFVPTTGFMRFESCPVVSQ